jgi:hypothetical protein
MAWLNAGNKVVVIHCGTWLEWSEGALRGAIRPVWFR